MKPLRVRQRRRDARALERVRLPVKRREIDRRINKAAPRARRAHSENCSPRMTNHATHDTTQKHRKPFHGSPFGFSAAQRCHSFHRLNPNCPRACASILSSIRRSRAIACASSSISCSSDARSTFSQPLRWKPCEMPQREHTRRFVFARFDFADRRALVFISSPPLSQAQRSDR